MEPWDDQAFIEAYQRLKSGTPQPGDRELVQTVREHVARQGADTAALDEVLGTDWGAEASSLTPSTTPSVGDQVSQALGQASDYLQNPPGAANFEGYEGAAPGSIPPGTQRESLGDIISRRDAADPGWFQTTPDLPDMARAPVSPFVDVAPRAVGGEAAATTSYITSPVGGLAGGATVPRGVTEIPGTSGSIGGGSGELGPADRGGARRNRAARGGTDWEAEANAISGQLPAGSAFAEIESGMLPTLAADPSLAADFIARNRGVEGSRGGAMIAPQLAQIMNLNQTGILGGRRGVGSEGGYEGPRDQLQAAESLLNEMGPGSYFDPQTLHRRTIRNLRKTDPTTMFGGEGVGGEEGDINNQIAVTNSAVMAAAEASMTGDAAAAMQARLQNAEQEYITGVVDGSIVPSEMSYPQWLRTVKKVRKWVGPGATGEQWQQAFSTE